MFDRVEVPHSLVALHYLRVGAIEAGHAQGPASGGPLLLLVGGGRGRIQENPNALYRETKDIHLAQQLLRHASPATTQIYLYPTRDDLAAALRGMDAAWEEVSFRFPVNGRAMGARKRCNMT